MVIHKVDSIEVKKRQLLKLLNGAGSSIALAKARELGKQLNIDWSIGATKVKAKLIAELNQITDNLNLEYGKNKKKRS